MPSTHSISIHALREEGDSASSLRTQAFSHFYPRPPRGGRRSPPHTAPRFRHFYPRPPRGGRPDIFRVFYGRGFISIHALREEGDSLSDVCLSPAHYFYPRPPRGGRPCYLATHRHCKTFLSTPSARRATVGNPALYKTDDISIHALREEGDLTTTGQCWQTSVFLSTPSARRATGSKRCSKTNKPISIHALREEGDIPCGKCLACRLNFYPRPPRGGRRPLFSLSSGL